MKSFTILLLVLSSVLSSNLYAQEKSLKELFEEVLPYLQNESHYKAIPILKQMEEKDPKNYNTKFNLGYSYLHTELEKEKAIPYFEEILSDYQNLTAFHQPDKFKESRAPLETLYFLGLAYHYEYKFEEAIERYKEYKEVLDPQNTEALAKVTRSISISRNGQKLKETPVELELENLANINTEYPEYRPKVNGDETVLYFTSRRKTSDKDPMDEQGKYYEDVYVSYKKLGMWSDPEKISDNINTAAHDACLYVSPDDSYMLIFKASTATLTEGGIYESRKENGEWTAPQLLNADINSNYWETDVSLSADGNTMFFTSDRPDGQGGRDIWVMKRLPGGDWANVQNIGAMINTEYDEEAPYLHPDGKTLFFSSDGHNTMGGFDVFKSELQSDGTWGAPENIGYPINTTGDDVFYFPSNDGQRAYFSSYRSGGQGDQDIYILKLPNNVERTLAVYKGIAKYDDGEVIDNLIINIYDEETGELQGIYRPNDQTGRFLFILKPGQRYEVEYDAGDVAASENIDVPEEGGVQDITKILIREGDKLFIRAGKVDDNNIIALVENDNPDNLEITDINISAPVDSTKKDETNVTEYTSESSMLNDVYFRYDRTLLIESSEKDYDAALEFLKNNPSADVKIEGHTDSHGSYEYNTWLSSARANKIRNRLYDDGIAWGRMKTYGYSEGKPIAPNKNPDGSDNPDGRQKNRRVHFNVEDYEKSMSATTDTASSFIALENPTETYSEAYEDNSLIITNDIVCMVQLGAFSGKLEDSKFTEHPLEVAFYQDEDGLYKYLSGAFMDKKVALEHRLNMIKKGYEGAFIVYFQDGKRLTQEQIALLYPTEEGLIIENNQAAK